jgi:hypothetical protein
MDHESERLRRELSTFRMLPGKLGMFSSESLVLSQLLAPGATWKVQMGKQALAYLITDLWGARLPAGKVRFVEEETASRKAWPAPVPWAGPGGQRGLF